MYHEYMVNSALSRVSRLLIPLQGLNARYLKCNDKMILLHTQSHRLVLIQQRALPNAHKLHFLLCCLENDAHEEHN